MKLTTQQKKFFDAFGYLHLPGLIAKDLDWINQEFEAVFEDLGIVHDGSKRSTCSPFIDRRERFCTLLDHAGLDTMLTSLLGENYNYLSGDGNYYSGNTHWHPDGEHAAGTYIKVAFYLDPVTRDSGALRVVPGSHRWHSIPGSDDWRGASYWDSRGETPARNLWGVDVEDVPSVALESQPGDAVLFSHSILHASYGGSGFRRMFSLNFGSPAVTPDEIDALDNYLRNYLAPRGDRAYGEIMCGTASAERRRHLQQVIDMESQIQPSAKVA